MQTLWRPTATLNSLKQRAKILTKVREFFEKRHVLEVQTPLLSASTVTDPHLESFHTFYHSNPNTTQKLYLQTSPEFAMKRLLAAGSGPIYQITQAFRNQGEQGRWHNPEFSMLEWYRPNFTLSDLMDETQALLQLILNCSIVQRITYSELFQRFSNLDPHQASLSQIKQTLADLKIYLQPINWLTHRDTGLQLIVDHLVKSHIDPHHLLFLYDFPASQAALARIKNTLPPVAERVEVYYKGIELANGFYELSDPIEQKRRFLDDLAVRKQQDLPEVPIDEYFIAALQHGLPDCSGIALGLDRLVALATDSSNIAKIISFPISRA